jgi:hypothetical protein
MGMVPSFFKKGLGDGNTGTLIVILDEIYWVRCYTNNITLCALLDPEDGRLIERVLESKEERAD